MTPRRYPGRLLQRLLADQTPIERLRIVRATEDTGRLPLPVWRSAQSRSASAVILIGCAVVSGVLVALSILLVR